MVLDEVGSATRTGLGADGAEVEVVDEEGVS